MMDRKQSAHARREAQRLQESNSYNTTNNSNAINQLASQTEATIANIQNNLTNVSLLSTSTATNLTAELDPLDPTSWESRITELENNPSTGGGGGGIDPSDPDQPIIIVDNFIRQPNGDPSGTGGLFIYPDGNTTILNTNGLPIVFTESEVDHNGIIIVRLSIFDTNINYYILGQTATADVCKFTDVSTLYYIIKTPATLQHSIRIGFMDDYGSSPSANEICFERLTGEANISVVTRSGGTQTKTSSGIAYSANTWYTFKISRTASNTVDFTINTTTVNQTTNIPTGFMNVGVQIQGNGSNSADEDFKFDFFSLKLGDVAAVLPTGTTVVGTANEVEVTTVGSVITVGLPNSIIVPTINTSQLNFNITPASPTNTIGGQYWDTTYNTLSLGLTANTNLKIGQSLYKYVKNTTGSSIPKGKVVYINGHFSSTQLTIGLANASTEATSADVVGVTAEDIANNASGFVQTFGYLTGFATNTAEIPTGQEGKALYLSATTSGDMRIGLPIQPLHGVRVGFLVQRAGSGSGAMFVNIQNYQEIEELSDVEITSIAANDILQWDNTDLRWENRSLSSAGIAAAAHTHGNITNAGAIGSTSGLPIITTTSGQLTTGTFGTTTGTFCAGDDSRLLSNSDKGDITVSGSPIGSTWTIDNSAVTYAKMQNVSTNNRLLGRSTAGSGVVEEITVGSGLSLSAGTLTSSATPGGSTGQIQYNNSSAFAGATNVKINSDNLELVKPSTEPTTAPANSIIMYVKDIGQRDLPAFVDSSGWSTNLQTCIARNKFNLMAFNGGTNAAPSSVGMVFTATTVGTGNTTGGTVAIGTTSLLSGSRRQSFLTANTAGNAAGWRTSSTQCWRGNAPKRGGFFCVWKFGIGDATFQPNATLFVGLNDSTAVPDATAIADPFGTSNATMRNTVGLALYGGSSTYQVIHRNGTTGATAISTGFTANINDIVEFCLYCIPNDSTIYYYVKIYSSAGSDTETSGNIGTSNIPVNTTLFVPHCWRGRTSTATAAVQVDCLTFSIEQPH
jgi:hypothetical protein